MAERQLAWRPGLADRPLPQRDAMFVVTEVPPASRFVLRTTPAVAGSCGDAIGLDLRQPLHRAVSRHARSALRLGPDEWWLSVPVEEGAGVAHRLAAIEGAHALVDVSHREISLSLAGTAVVDVLASACPQPLDIRRFPLDRCTRTVFAQAEIVLWRRGEQGFQLDVARSFAPYVVGLLARELQAL